MVMTLWRKRVLLLALFCAALAALCLAPGKGAYAYPPAGEGYAGWTAESTVGLAGACHVQTAAGSSHLYMAADNGYDIYFYWAADKEVLGWDCRGLLDYNPAATARDAYLDAEGSCVAVSWKENAGSTWYLVVALSLDHGANWLKWVDYNPAWNNYEAHVDIRDGKLHCAYVSDYPAQGQRRNEVYYRRFDLGLSLEVTSCVSDNLDGVPASQPCIEATSASFCNVYYQRGAAAPRPVCEGYSADGMNWSPPIEILSTGGGTDFSWPEVAVFWEGGDRRKMVVADGRNVSNQNRTIYYSRYAEGWWMDKGKCLIELGPHNAYPQISSLGNRLLVTFRQSGGSLGNQGGARMNTASGEQGSWKSINSLFYGNFPVDNPGCVDCCCDASRFYAAQAGSGEHPELMTKREDTADPAVIIADPGRYHNADFRIAAYAVDDFKRSGAWMLGPAAETTGDYQWGITYAEFFYRLNGGPWMAFYGGSLQDDHPWERTFGLGPDGTYDFLVRARDTALRSSDALYQGVIVDRQPPLASPYVSGGKKGEGGWYTGAPSVGCNFSDQGTPPSGVDEATRQYRRDALGWQSYGSPFPALEGSHSYYFTCRDKAGNYTATADVSTQVKLDTKPPSAEASLPAADGENGWRISEAAATVTLTGSDPAGGSGLHSLLYAWDAPPNAVYKAPLVAPEGTHTLYYRARDVAGNWGEIKSLEVRADYHDPAVGLLISEPNGEHGWFMQQPTTGPRVEGSDAGSGIFQTCYRFDGQGDWNVFSSPFALPEGTHTINFYAQDWAGRRSAEGSYAYKADLTDPQGAVTAPSGGSYLTTELSMQVEARDDLSGVERVEFYLEGESFGSDDTPPYGKKTSLENYADGQKVTRARVYDRAGRWSWTEQVMVFKDATPPTVEIVEPTGEHWVRGMVTVRADVRDNLEVGRARFHVDGEVIDERTSPPWIAAWDTSKVVNGYHALRVEAWDKAGNQAEAGAAGEVAVYVGNNISETNNFAEGCTRPGFDTWLCLQNPGGEPAEVTVNYYLGEGQGAASARTYALPAHSRTTVYVNGDVGAGKDVSIQVTSSRPIVSERPMYFDYQGASSRSWKGCHTAQGAHFPRGEWYFAEGCTRPGFDTWLCLQNPQGNEAAVRVEYMMENGAYLERFYRLAPWSRGTIAVNREVGEGHDVSMRVISDTPIVAERPVYFLYQGMWDGGAQRHGGRPAGTGMVLRRGLHPHGLQPVDMPPEPQPRAHHGQDHLRHGGRGAHREGVRAGRPFPLHGERQRRRGQAARRLGARLLRAAHRGGAAHVFPLQFDHRRGLQRHGGVQARLLLVPG